MSIWEEEISKFLPAMVEHFKRIFSHFITANLNVSFNSSEWIFYHFGRINFDISECSVVMVKMKCPILLGVSQNLSQGFSFLKGESVWSLTLGDDKKENKNITGGPIIINYDLVRPESFGDLQSLIHVMGHRSSSGVWWNCFSCKLIDYHFPLALIFC